MRLRVPAHAPTEIASSAHSDIITTFFRLVLSVTRYLRCVCTFPRNSYTVNSAYLYSCNSSSRPRFVHVHFFHATSRTCLYQPWDPRFIRPSLALRSLASCRSTLLPESQHLYPATVARASTTFHFSRPRLLVFNFPYFIGLSLPLAFSLSQALKHSTPREAGLLSKSPSAR